MTLRLSNAVVCGELFNTRNNSVHGWIAFDGEDRPLSLQLTGNCDPDLFGKHIRFETVKTANDSADDPDLTDLAWQQVGPTGRMTAVASAKPGEATRLYLEWFSQNGRVVVELADPKIEYIDVETEHENADEETTTFDISNPLDDLENLAAEESGESYGLIPDELQQQLDEAAFELDRAIESDDDKDDVVRELEMMDTLMENGQGVPVGTVFDTPFKLPRPDQLESDEEAEGALKTLLAKLALHGIALDICEHFSAKDAYKLMIDQICHDEEVFPELRNTQWVQHFSTWEYCPKCTEEIEREFPADENDDDDNEVDAFLDENDEEMPF